MIIPLPPFTRSTLRWVLRSAKEARLRIPGILSGFNTDPERFSVRFEWNPYVHGDLVLPRGQKIDPDWIVRTLEVSEGNREVGLL
jgi:hypothetical protein